MKLEIYQVDAFSDKIFSGNPACVVPLRKWYPDEFLLNIAKENSVSETAFFINKGSFFELRWFTPDHEIDLCGHATLASAHVIKSVFKNTLKQILFKTFDKILNSLLPVNTLILVEKSSFIIFSESRIICIIGSIILFENLRPNHIERRIIKKLIAIKS